MSVVEATTVLVYPLLPESTQTIVAVATRTAAEGMKERAVATYLNVPEYVPSFYKSVGSVFFFEVITMASRRQPVEEKLDADVFGRSVSFNYSETWLGYSLLGLRIVMAWVFLQAGLSKMAEGGFSDPLAWSSTGFLENAIAGANPLSGLFTWFANYGAIVDPLVIFGQILIGLALLFGAVFRFAAMMGALQMFFFWTAAWQGGLMEGFPMAHGWFVDSTFVYLLLLFGLGAWGAGRIAGLDAKLEQSSLVQNNPWLRYLLG